MLALGEQIRRNLDRVEARLDGLDRHAGGNPAHDRHAHRLGQALALGHLRHATKASFDHAWRETARPAGPERLGH